MLFLLRTIFLEEQFAVLDTKYNNILEGSYDRAFLHANFMSIFDYYHASSFKNRKYVFPDKRMYEKFAQSIAFFIKKCKETKYDPELVCLLYGYVCNIVFNYHTMPYMHAFSKNINRFARDLEKQYFALSSMKAINPANKYSQNFQLSADEEETINDYLLKVYFFKHGLSIFRCALTNLHTLYRIKDKPVSLSKFSFFLKRLTNPKSPKHKYLHHSKRRIRHSVLNNDYQDWYHSVFQATVHYSFLDIYSQATAEATQIINAVNEILFYNHEKSWKTINEYAKKIAS